MFHGSMVALITPMLDDKQIDYEALARLIAWHLEEKTDALVILGTTGESPTINQTEREKIIQFVLAEVNERVPVIIGTGTNNTEQSIHYTEQAMAFGANAALVVTPYYNKPTQQGLFEHYVAIAKATPLPIILYNVPGRTGCDLTNETVERLAITPNIVGLKDATGQINRAEDFFKRQLPLDLYSGDDATALQLMELGGKGVISVVANIVPRLMHNMATAALTKNKSKAEELNRQLHDLYSASTVEANPIPTKWALSQMSKIRPSLRLPLTPLSGKCQGTMRAAMQKAGISLVEISE